MITGLSEEDDTRRRSQHMPTIGCTNSARNGKPTIGTYGQLVDTCGGGAGTCLEATVIQDFVELPPVTQRQRPCWSMPAETEGKANEYWRESFPSVFQTARSRFWRAR
jgi:hypothetical protein